MKKKKLLLVLLVLVFCLTLLPTTANADYVSQEATYGIEHTTYVFLGNYGEYVSNYWIEFGTLPDGMYLTTDGQGVLLRGTPWVEGPFTPRIIIDTSFARYSIDLALYIKHNPGYDPKPQPTPVPVWNPPVVTKSPAGETVEAGGSALFIARANNYTGIAWYLVRSDYSTYIPVESIGSYFEGAWASNYYTEKLTIGGIPKSMNGWMVQCYFNSPYGEVWSGAAPITVTNPAPKPTPTPAPTPAPAQKPVITTQPVAVTAEIGQNATLSVAANSPDSGNLTYQWYESITNDIHTMSPILAAESSTFNIPQTEGTKYYCCIIFNNKGDSKDYLVSDIVTATMTAPKATPVPEVTPEPAPAPTEAPAAAEAMAPAAPAVPAVPAAPAAPAQGVPITYVLYGVIGLLAVMVIVLLIVVSKRKR